MAFLDDVTDDAALFLDEFGEPTTHRPEGLAAGDATVNAIVELQPAADEETRGQGRRIRGTLQVAASLTVTEQDRWKVRGTWFECERLNPPEGGLREIHVNQTQIHSRTAEGRTSRQA